MSEWDQLAQLWRQTGEGQTNPVFRGLPEGDNPADYQRAEPARNVPAGNYERPADLRSGILATAQALGVDPVDLATAISYETAGTFDPTKRGPTTQWGQHRGLIQFGEPQARQYGVDWNDPVGSQLGPNGAVAKYLRDTGVRPGMGMMDIYSAINAGGVGRYNASDANNGGAPGTVADKVNNQMAAHRAKALELLGGGEMPAGYVQTAQGQPQNYLAPQEPQKPEPFQMQNTLQNPADYMTRPVNQLAQGGFSPQDNPCLSYLRQA